MPFLPVGGQAVIEGVMMRSPSKMSVAVRRPDGTLATLEAFRTNERGLHPLTLTDKADCNGYWQRVAGLELRQ